MSSGLKGKKHFHSSHSKALNKVGMATPQEKVLGKFSKKDKFKIVRRPGYRYSLEENK